MYIWVFVVPVVAKFLSPVKDILVLNIFGEVFKVNIDLPFSWNVMFFSSLLFMIGEIIFNIFCPKLLLDHENYTEFKESGKGVQQLADYSLDVNDQYKNILYGSYGKQSIEKASESNIFYKLYKESLLLHCKTRFFISILYYIGFILLGILLIQNIGWVIKVIL
jgi:hypothetical protein